MEEKKDVYILAIESSCDETAAAVVKNGRDVLSNIISSQIALHLSLIHISHLIATLFNGCAFGPPSPFTATSTWTWVDHPVSGLRILTICALFRLGFPSAPHLKCLTLPVPVTRRTVLQKVRGWSYKDLPQIVNTGFQVLFHSPPGRCV